jgi:cytochrome c556
MKKVLLIAALLSSALVAQEGLQILHAQRMQNMQDMETALSTIQKGFLFDNIHVVKNGVNDLKKTSANTESYIKDGVNDKGVNTLVYAKQQAKEIAALTDDILVSFEKGDRYNAANSYLQILSKCLSCHQTVRSW